MSGLSTDIFRLTLAHSEGQGHAYWDCELLKMVTVMADVTVAINID